MPNALASLPPGTVERGFMNFNGSEKFGKLYPNHNSLYKELKNNGYHSSYYYGGWGYFDYMQLFVNEQGTDVFFDDTNFDSTKYISPKKIDPNTFCWGYDDASMFSQCFIA